MVNSAVMSPRYDVVTKYANHWHLSQFFPSLIYCMIKPKVILLIFVSGKFVLTGKVSFTFLHNSFLSAKHWWHKWMLLLTVHSGLFAFGSLLMLLFTSLGQKGDIHSIQNHLHSALRVLQPWAISSPTSFAPYLNECHSLVSDIPMQSPNDPPLPPPMAISSQHPAASLSVQDHRVLPIFGGGTNGETSFTLQPHFAHISSPISSAPISSPISFVPIWPPLLICSSPTSFALQPHFALISSPISFAHLQPPLLSNLLCSFTLWPPLLLWLPSLSDLALLSSHLPSPSLISSFTPLQPPLLSDLLCSFTPLWPPSLSNLLCSPTSLCSHLTSHLLRSSLTSFTPFWPHFTPISSPISFFSSSTSFAPYFNFQLPQTQAILPIPSLILQSNAVGSARLRGWITLMPEAIRNLQLESGNNGYVKQVVMVCDVKM